MEEGECVFPSTRVQERLGICRNRCCLLVHSPSFQPLAQMDVEFGPFLGGMLFFSGLENKKTLRCEESPM